MGLIQGEYKALKCPNLAAMARHLGRHHSVIERALAYKEDSPPVRKPRKVPENIQKRRKVTVDLAKEIVLKDEREYPKNPTVAEIRESMPAKLRKSRSTVARDLKESDFVCRVRHKVPTRDPGKKRERLSFAKGWLKPSKLKQHKLIVFSDEHILSINDHSSRTMWVKRGEEYRIIPRERRRMQNIPRIMIWAAVGHDYKSDLVIFPQEKKEEEDKRRKDKMTYRVSADAYIRRCLSKVVPSLKQKNRIYQQDGATPHGKNRESSRVVKYLRQKKIELVLPWPSESPDMNMIERVWKDLNRRVSRMKPTSLQDLTRCAKLAWEQFPQRELNKIVGGFTSHLRKVVDVGGGVPK